MHSAGLVRTNCRVPPPTTAGLHPHHLQGSTHTTQTLWLRDLGWILRMYISNEFSSKTGEGNGNPLQYSCLENPMDGGAWWAEVHGVTKSQTQLSNFMFTFHFHALEKEMATHSSVLAWRIPGMGEPGWLTSMGSQRVGHDWSHLASKTAALCCSRGSQFENHCTIYTT